MSIGWGSLPLLPLRCVLEHLSTEDALAAMSACQHWRAAILLYEGYKDTLKLRAKQLEKNMFLTRLFKKNARLLHVYLDCSEVELQNFMTYVLPQFFDAVKLQEIVFIGLSYIQQNQNIPLVKLKRVITESLVFKHLQSLNKLALIGCEMDIAKNENDRYTHKQLEYYSRPLSFNTEPSAMDTVLSSSNIGIMAFSALQSIVVEYDQINTKALETLSHLPMFSHLTLNVVNKRGQTFLPVDWSRVNARFPNGLEVAVNIIALPYRKLNDVMENVLVEGLTLTALKVMFCKCFYTLLISHVVRFHNATLRELVWVDCPYDSVDAHHRLVPHTSQPEYECNVNPIILLCWQCVQLRRLVIHGYWVWQYDILGFVRLRKTLQQLEISSIYNKPGRLSSLPSGDGSVLRVLVADSMRALDEGFVEEVNSYTDFEWRPVPWSKLPAGLRARASASQRAEYIVSEACRPSGATLYTA